MPAGPGFPQPTFAAPRGTTPQIDGTISEDEWLDAVNLLGMSPFNVFQFAPVASKLDLGLDQAWIKYDDAGLYFAFGVIDDVAYATETPWWEPKGNPEADLLNRTGWPWFGDEMEIIINSQPGVSGGSNSSVVGNASQWQMCVNTCKSRLGGKGTAGLMEAEPRDDNGTAWSLYRQWIESGVMRAASKPRTDVHGYTIEWFVGFQAIVLADGLPFDPATAKSDTRIGINIALGDVDTPESGDVTYGFHHENWLSGKKNTRTRLNELATLWLMLPPVLQ